MSCKCNELKAKIKEIERNVANTQEDIKNINIRFANSRKGK